MRVDTLLKKEPLERYKQLRLECRLRSTKGFCCYWEKKTKCSFLYCPFFNYKVESKRKQALIDRQKYSVWFDVSDFDSKKTVQDLINESPGREYQRSTPKNEDVDIFNYISELFGLDSRLICQSCGERIFDDKYFCIPDPSNNSVLRYYHSKGKCDFRRENIAFVREQWLQRQSED